MKKKEELQTDSLKNECLTDSLSFNKTSELEPFNGIIGQERALNAIKTSVKIHQKGFNLYVCGNVGIGKTSYVMSVVKAIAETQPIPKDYCYIHNFDNPNEPIAICLEPGQGTEFKQDMNKFIKTLLARLSKDLSGDTFDKEKKNIEERYAKMKDEIMKEFDKSTFKQGFKARNTENGIYFSPVHNGVVINEKEFNELDDATKKYFEEKSPEIQEQTLRVLKQLDDLDKKCESNINEWQTNLTTFAVTQCMSDLKIKYKNNLKIQNFFYSIQSDVVKNAEFFKMYEDDLRNKKANKQNLMPMSPLMNKVDRTPWENYRVNLLVDNDKTRHAPVVLCKNPNYFDLFGKLEFETSMGGGMRTNYKLLKPGLFHKANGGYLIVNVRDLLVSQPTWEAFKRVIRNQELSIDSSRDISQPVTVVSLKPEPIPIDVQVILIGSELHYQQLCAMDVDFKKLFKIKADFDETYERNEENITKLAQFVAFVCKKYNLLPFNSKAVSKIIEYSSKCANDQNKLTAIMNDISDLVIESSFIAKQNSKKIVSYVEVKKAIDSKVSRFSKYNEGLNEMITNGDIMISTSGKKVGEINGLTILNTGDISFGKPVKITANTFMGKTGVLNIEREVQMSGNTHSKGVFILSSLLGQKYAQEFPLSLTASICFEQLYNGVDGDSASSTELYAILSSLSGIPINQSLAVTGSVNQKGEIQPIGGVTEKIEGFFNICKHNGLNGENGVLIPKQNVKNLNLSEEIIKAVENGKFHIYPITSIDEGIEILTGVNSGKRDENGEFEKDSVNYLVEQKLKKYADQSVKYK